LTSSIETFAKVRALHDSTTNPGEKASAADRMKALAGKAGMTVDQALSKLDEPPVTIVASATVDMGDAFNAFFNTPQMRADRAERERLRAERRAVLLVEYGSEAAVFDDTPLEAALRAACEPLLGPGEIWDGIYRLDGWGMLDSRATMPESVRRAVSTGWPMPTTVVEAWAEFEAAEKIADARCAFCYEHTPHAFVEGRRYLIEALLNTLPARSLNDLLARGAWLEFWARAEISQSTDERLSVVTTLRADIERMGQRLRAQGAC